MWLHAWESEFAERLVMTTIGSATYYPSFVRSPGAGSSETTAAADAFQTTFKAQQETIASNGIDSSRQNIRRTWELPEEDYQRIIDGMEAILEADYRQFPEMPDLSDYPAIQPYASIIVDGKVVATVDNQGGVSTDGPLGDKLREIMVDNVNGTNGPDLAQARAEQIARLIGGDIVKSDTAMTQADFNALPPFEAPRPTVNYTAMIADSRYTGLQELEQMRQDYLAQQLTVTEILV